MRKGVLYMLKSLTERLKKLWKAVSEMEPRRLGWYALLALVLTALGLASHDWRRTRADSAALQAGDQSMAAMAGATPAPQDTLTTLPTPAPTPEPMAFEWPLPGEIIGAWAPEALTWSDTLGQWQTHPALDIAAGAGEAVCACAAGEVSDTWEDALWGKVIQIDHGEGYVSTYANLSTLKLVSPGDAVEAGQVISAVGSSAACEAELPWHLHFCLEKDGVPVNFEKIVLRNET